MNPQLGFSIGSTVCPGLSKLIEECGEVLQVAGKLIATGGTPNHWDGTDLHQEMQDELADLQAAIVFFGSRNGIDFGRFSERTEAKLELYKKWHVDQLAAAATPEKTE